MEEKLPSGGSPAFHLVAAYAQSPLVADIHVDV
jgi:hypothetical protein